MRTAGTEIRQTGRYFLCVVRTARLVHCSQSRHNTFGIAPFLDQNLAQLFSDFNRIKRPSGPKQHFAIFRPAINTAAPKIIKQGFLYLDLDQLAFFFNHDDQIQIIGPSIKAAHIQRPCLAHFIGGDAQTLGLGLVNV